MYWTEFFIPTNKEIPADAKIPSHQLMIRSGMIKQESSGIYSWLPLGFKVLKKIEKIVREEQEKAGAIEMLMPTLQAVELWKESGRYDGYGKEMLKIIDRHNRFLIYGPTNEEQVTEIFRAFVKSYKNLPLNLFHIQWKFRDEIRPRFGVMRGREFLMKDAYSFDLNEEESKKSYYKMFISYIKIFKRLKINTIPVVADSGEIGGSLSHEFSIITNTGEGQVYCDKRLFDLELDNDDLNNLSDLERAVGNYTQFYSATEDKHNEKIFKEKVPEEFRLKGKAIEVGHIFSFGEKYSSPMKAYITNKEGKNVSVYMGSYGIGVSRLVAAIIEYSHDKKGIIWPNSVTPFHVGIINVQADNKECLKVIQEIKSEFEENNLEVLVDDRDESVGKKYADMDLIGLPYILTIGPRDIKEKKVEVKFRHTETKESLSIEEAINKISNLAKEEVRS